MGGRRLAEDSCRLGVSYLKSSVAGGTIPGQSLFLRENGQGDWTAAPMHRIWVRWWPTLPRLLQTQLLEPLEKASHDLQGLTVLLSLGVRLSVGVRT
jgi:hypothetical protein